MTGIAEFVEHYTIDDRDQVDVRLQLLESAFSEFKEVRNLIEAEMDELEDEDEPELDEKEADRLARLEAAEERRDVENDEILRDAENLYCRLKGSLLKHRIKDESVASPPAVTASVSAYSKIKLPEIKLPTFCGKLRDWVPFRDAFRSLIHRNEKLTDMDRFTYLRSSVSGEALQAISSIELTAANYTVAWTSLERRYQNTKLIVKAHLEALFGVAVMKRENFESLNHVLSEFDKNLQMLEKLGQETAGWSTILVHMLCARLDPVTLRLWETHHNSKEVPAYEDLISFLRNHCAVLQSVGHNILPPIADNKRPRFGVSHPSTSGRCSFCSEPSHSAFICKRFQNLSVSERYDTVRKHGLCVNCLSGGHLARNCTRGMCRNCGRRHHTLLHPSNASANSGNEKQKSRRPPTDNNQQTLQTPTQNTATATPTPTNTNTPSTITLTVVNPHSHSTHPRPATGQPFSTKHTVTLQASNKSITRQVLLSTALVRVSDAYGNTILARALLDSCSQYCFVTTSFCRKLKLKEFSDYLSIQGIGGSGDFEIYQWNVPNEIILADPDFNKAAEIDMIIGAEYYLDLLLDGKRKLWKQGPTLQNTVFGWIVSGRLTDSTSALSTAAVYLCSTTALQDQVTKFWELESCQVKSTYSIEETRCEEIFEQTTTRDDTGRFVVTLPKKDYVIQKLGDSKASALRRFMSLERRFATNPEMKTLYCEFIREYQYMGHMRKVDDQAVAPGPVYYLPHHAVLKPDSTTTKLRVVFDASSRTSTGIALNDGLMVGPVVQDDLMSIIIRFRMYRLALVADIAKMYRMINVQQSDQGLQRIIWRESENDPIQTFELTTVTYGTSAAPYLATRCLRRLAEDGDKSHPVAAKVLKKDFYVDDMITGVSSVKEGRSLIREMNNLLDSAGFILRKWNSNCQEILADLPAGLRDHRDILELDSSTSTVKTLGLAWEPCTDCFRFEVPRWNTSAIVTKRVILSDASKLFDPLGLVGPVIVQAKIFIQTLWKLNCKWDEPLMKEFQDFWQEYRRNLIALDSPTVPRWVGPCQDCVSVELHGFCDASERAYGACLYLRCVSSDGSVAVRLLMSKSRVAPLDEPRRNKRKQSIPRLELSSALLLSHLFQRFRSNIPTTTMPHFWTDSKIVQCWLASSPSRWQAFVGNRVSEIQHITRCGVWHHVPGTENPADILSRGMTPAQLQYQAIWFDGPLWMRQETPTWPVNDDVNFEQFESAVLEERSVVSLALQAQPPSEIFSLYLSFPKLIRIVALIRRFRYNATEINRGSRMIGLISTEEYDKTIIHLVQLSQRESFSQELLDLARNDEVRESSKICSLRPRLVDGIMRVGGRLRDAPVSDSRKHPMIIHHNHPLAMLILAHYHTKLYHAGQQLLIARVRERYWPTRIRDLARKLIHGCISCFRARPRPLDQLMADLPAERVTPAPPFLHVGVDYCGPFLFTYANRRSSPKKCFVSIFVCLVTKAVHLELVQDLTTEAFLAALKRFVARRGHPTVIMCDNAKNFVGANRELDELRRLFEGQQFQHVITRDTAVERIEFKFIPARTPNFGGLWEAAVKSFKTALKKTVGPRTLQFDEFQTVITQVEAVLNSRPITPISNDPNDFEALTPGHFLVQRPLTAIAEPNLDSVPTNRLSSWQRAQHYVQMLWEKWTTLYLSDLHNRTKWTRQRDNIAVGTMVLLMDERLPPLRWHLGRVTDIVRGPDNNIRIVNVRTKDGIYKRGITKICVLPIRDNAMSTNGGL
ncbi:uncharacterized protein LOC131688381 [Topomyia yanbarensis]|uniref:uncharacterized protein LOC131688381 n=1 Tax=Topomyia yanbarensis TaxID=2498891 RepID=UPI00273A8833|nr:uncharacterized protein LOC131688381 [Topomyia yanbarensis]